jgi:mono/diheme cytochrome c family protein
VAVGEDAMARFEAGKQVTAQSGCLACHKIGENGNDGPGPELTDIGARLPREAIERTLINPTAPMPSFETMPDEQRDVMVEFLSQLKGETGSSE